MVFKVNAFSREPIQRCTTRRQPASCVLFKEIIDIYARARERPFVKKLPALLKSVCILFNLRASAFNFANQFFFLARLARLE